LTLFLHSGIVSPKMKPRNRMIANNTNRTNNRTPYGSLARSYKQQ